MLLLVQPNDDNPKLRLIALAPALAVSIIAIANSSGVVLGKRISFLSILFFSSRRQILVRTY
ncbi:MAG TPA: hypothetical protein VD694_08855 [Nitrososphaeraceae archaeon]|nr:hypothetical protein [Nitrososphaeraceae archaeon]